MLSASMLSSYTPNVFSGLSDFCAARKYIEPSRQVLPTLGKIIRAHGLEESVGISLLHKHFEITPDERLVKTCYTRGSSMEPREARADFVPYSWKAGRDKESGRLCFFPTEFLADEKRNRASLQLAGRLQASKDFLSDIGTKLCELDMEDIFGVASLPGSDIEVGSGQILLEETDEVNRAITVTLVSDKVLAPGVEETLWTFGRPSNEVEAALDCAGHCFGCCNSHQKKEE